MMHTEDEAKKTRCPEYPAPINCISSDCAHWRWLPLTVKEPGWFHAVQTLMAEGMTHKAASQAVLTAEVKVRFKLPLVPYKGFCGVSGVPL